MVDQKEKAVEMKDLVGGIGQDVGVRPEPSPHCRVAQPHPVLDAPKQRKLTSFP
jgi:hypothetical protein